jgi:hypothetical protein
MGQNGFLYTDRASFEKGQVDIWLEFTATTSGAVPSTLTRAKGISSVVLTSTGLLTVNLRSTYAYLFEVTGSIAQASLSASTGMIVTPAITTAVTHATVPKIVLNMLSAAGAAADMAIGDVFRMHAVVGRLKL